MCLYVLWLFNGITIRFGNKPTNIIILLVYGLEYNLILNIKYIPILYMLNNNNINNIAADRCLYVIVEKIL